MDAAINESNEANSIVEQMHLLGHQAREASRILAIASTESKNKALCSMAENLRQSLRPILDSNRLDIEAAKENQRTGAFIDRLTLTEKRIEDMAGGLEDIAALGDPVGEVMAEWDRPNGLKIQRVRVPLGVIGIIYESRPNVTADAGGLCIKSGNAVILRGGSESCHSSQAICSALVKGLKFAGLPGTSIQFVPTTDRAAVGEMLKGLSGQIDVIVPRGGKNLVARVQEEARVPVFAHLEGICHIYADETASMDMIHDVVVNAKMRRTGICGAAETLLVDNKISQAGVASIVQALIDAGCEVRGDHDIQKAHHQVKPATDDDWSTEYLDAIISIKTVDGVSEAIKHITKFGSQHTDSILSENPQAVEQFFNQVDSAIVLHNASTQFADGGEFGMGAEIGIATGKMHARGPVGVEQLTSFKYLVRGTGQIRPN